MAALHPICSSSSSSPSPSQPPYVLASGGADGQVCLFMPTLRRPRASRVADLPPEIEAEHSIQLEAEVTALAWTTGGGMLAVGDRSGTLSIYRVA